MDQPRKQHPLSEKKQLRVPRNWEKNKLLIVFKKNDDV